MNILATGYCCLERFEMEAGREMDALIAEKIMGWTKHEKCNKCSVSPRHVYIRGEYFGDDWEGKECHPYLRDPGGNRVYLCPCQERKDTELPFYSVNLRDMMDVIWQCRQLGFQVDISASPDRSGYEAISSPAGSSHRVSSYADTMPLAVCRAALTAAGLFDYVLQRQVVTK